MSTTTGATRKRVEQAAFKAYANPSLTDENYGEYAEWAMREAYRFAEALVSENERIVLTQLLIDARAQIGGTANSTERLRVLAALSEVIGE